MKKISLNGSWRIQGNGYDCFGSIPGSVYSVLLNNKLAPNPHYRDNENIYFELMKHNYSFSRNFDIDYKALDGKNIILCCDGLDTVCDIYINEKFVGHTENMHLSYEFDVTNFLSKKNSIRIEFTSPVNYAHELNEKEPWWGVGHCTKGFAHVRKAHCMFGWDWGQRLPDAGIYRDIYLLIPEAGKIKDTYISQQHIDKKVFLTPQITFEGEGEIEITLTSPKGEKIQLTNNLEKRIDNPELWWPNGYGSQPLYQVEISLIGNEKILDSVSYKMGLRTITVTQEKDENGVGFCHTVNGKSILAMGSNIIPIDNILSRVSRERTYALLKACADANYNMLRVWGGGYYPDDYFYEICDELGILVWQDFMFACASYITDKSFDELIVKEATHIIKRLRSHPCLALWCGNNEVSLFETWGPKGDNPTKRAHRKIFNGLLADLTKELNPEIFYLPTSPYGAEGDENPNDFISGDTHYWAGTEYKNLSFRYLSEFGVCSFPSYNTIKSFTNENDRKISSKILDIHARVKDLIPNNIKNVGTKFSIPDKLEDLVYYSQLYAALQISDGIKHLRSQRNICSGILYWQLNDIGPVISWSAIDYYGIKKALWYFVKRAFKPIALNVELSGYSEYVNLEVPMKITEAQVYLCNETEKCIKGNLKYSVQNNAGEILYQNTLEISANEYSASQVTAPIPVDIDKENSYLYTVFEDDGKILDECVTLFTVPKYYNFAKPNITLELTDNALALTTDSFVYGLQIYCEDDGLELEDNYITMPPGTKRIPIKKFNNSKILFKYTNNL